MVCRYVKCQRLYWLNTNANLRCFPLPNQMVLVPKPNDSITTMLSQHNIKMYRFNVVIWCSPLTNQDVVVPKPKHIQALQKHTRPEFNLKTGLKNCGLTGGYVNVMLWLFIHRMQWFIEPLLVVFKSYHKLDFSCRYCGKLSLLCCNSTWKESRIDSPNEHRCPR